MEPLTLGFTIIFGIITLVSLIVGIGAWIGGIKANKELRKELDEFKKRYEDQELYIESLLGIRNRKKAYIIIEGIHAMYEKRYSNAIENFRRCLNVTSKESEQCAYLHLIGLNQYLMPDLEKAKKTFLEMVRVAEKKDIKAAIAAGLGYLAIIYDMLGEFKKALVVLERAYELDKEINNLRGQMFRLTLMGEVYLFLGQKQKALDSELQALETIKEIKSDKWHAMILRTLGMIYVSLGKPEEALEYLDKALDLYKKLKNPKGFIATLQIQGQVCYELLKDYEKALEIHKRVLKAAEMIGNLDLQVGELTNIANLYRIKNNYRKALKYYKSGLEIFERVQDTRGQANTIGNMGIVYLDLGNPQKALEHYLRALEMHKKMDYLEGQARQIGNIGVLYLNTGRFEEALAYLHEARDIFKKIKAKHLVRWIDGNISIVKEALVKRCGS